MLNSTVANGSTLSAFRPFTELDNLIDGHQAFEDRLALKVVPSLRQSDTLIPLYLQELLTTLGKGT